MLHYIAVCYYVLMAPSLILHNASWYMKAAYICVLVRQEHTLLLLLLQLELLCSYPQGFP